MNSGDEQVLRTAPVISAVGLLKRFGLTRAVDRVTLDIAAGETVCVVGPNGAGKTTLLLLLGGVLYPSRGHVTVFGLDRWRDSFSIRQRSTFLTSDPIFGTAETPYEFLRFYAQIYGMPKPAFLDRVHELAANLDISKYLRKPWGALSMGMVKKVGLTAAFLPDAELRILDEPFAGGIDPFAMDYLFGLFKAATARGETILFSTQVLEQAEIAADRILLLENGAIAALGTPQEIFTRAGIAPDTPRALYQAFKILAKRQTL